MSHLIATRLIPIWSLISQSQSRSPTRSRSEWIKPSTSRMDKASFSLPTQQQPLMAHRDRALAIRDAPRMLVHASPQLRARVKPNQTILTLTWGLVRIRSVWTVKITTHISQEAQSTLTVLSKPWQPRMRGKSLTSKTVKTARCPIQFLTRPPTSN